MAPDHDAAAPGSGALPGAGPPGPADAASTPNPADPRHQPTVARPKVRRVERIADALPDWTGSIRFRLTALYSLVLFALAALMVFGIYLVLAEKLHKQEVYATYRFSRVEQTQNGFEVVTGPPQSYRSLEQLANERALHLLRTYSLTAVGLLFLASLGVGWLVAGRVLAPIDRITAVARDIQATDLSRRIALRGPPDELKELADTFDAMLARLDEAFDSQQRFIQEASHELRNPLAVIRTNLDVALADPDPDPEEVRHTADLVRRTAERMSRLVDDLLDYARRGAPAHERERVELGDLVADVVEEFDAPASARDLRLVPAVEPGASVVGDRQGLRQALANLVSNAVRLAPEGSPVRVGCGREGEWAWMAVEDDGPGIPEDQRSLVFQRFWRAGPTGGPGERRSGLGLAIVEQVARDHRGGVGVVGSPAGGSIFTVWLPVEVDDAGDPVVPATPPAT